MDWIVDNKVNVSRICRDAQWDLGTAIRAAFYAGLLDPEQFVRFVLGEDDYHLTPEQRARMKRQQCNA